MIQGTSAQITKIAAVKFFYWLLEEGLLFKVLIPNLVHDEIMAESPDELVEKVSNKLQEMMEVAASYFVKVVKLKAVPETAKFWIH